jgi:hypothetical protein
LAVVLFPQWLLVDVMAGRLVVPVETVTEPDDVCVFVPLWAEEDLVLVLVTCLLVVFVVEEVALVVVDVTGGLPHSPTRGPAGPGPMETR